MNKSFQVRRPDSNLLSLVKQISQQATGDSAEAGPQIQTLAKAVLALSDYCYDLQQALEWLTKNATFPRRG